MKRIHYTSLTIRCGLIAALLLLTWLLVQSNSAASETTDANWPMYGHDAARSHRTSEPLPHGGDGKLHLQWAYSFGERVEIEVQPVVANGVVYIGVMNGKMYALDADDGSVVWAFQSGGPIPHTAAVMDGRVFFGSLDGKLYALSSAGGSLEWAYTTGGPIYSAPAVVDDTLYFGSTDGYLYALNTNNGALRWRYQTGGPVVTSPAVANNRVYFGSEDLVARCLNATSGSLVWQKTLTGVSMRNTHPVISDDGDVVIFVTVKPGVSSYLPAEEYPAASYGSNPVWTWNTFYQDYEDHRFVFFLDAQTGADLWNPWTGRFVPLPIPYWGLLMPVLGPDGDAWFPVPSGIAGHDWLLDKDMRLFEVNLQTGACTQVADGAEFSGSDNEVGRPTFVGDYYAYTLEDVGAFRASTGANSFLFGTPVHGFSSHMDPLAPLPSKHLWRYGGVIAMGGAPNSSPLIVANGQAYYVNYGWLYALGPTDRGYDPDAVNSLPFTSRDGRTHTLTYPRSDAPTYDEIKTEVEARVAAIIAAGHLDPIARFEHPGNDLEYNEARPFQTFGHEADLVRVLSGALSYVSPGLQSDLRTYLANEARDYLFNPDEYTYHYDCIRYSGGFTTGCDGQFWPIDTRWLADNDNLVGERLYAMWAYADATNDWSYVSDYWDSLIKPQFQKFVDAYNPARGFAEFEHWHVRRLSVNSQIGAALGTLEMAEHLGDTTTQYQAQTLLNNLIDSRIDLTYFVRDLYDVGGLTTATIRLDSDGTLNNDDIMTYYNNNGNLIPYTEVRNRDTDVRQVHWWDAYGYQIHASAGFMHYQALVGYFPLYPELATELRNQLFSETEQYVKSYEINDPWWWLTDLGHHKSAGGEHLYNSPTLAYSMFQTKAWVLQEDWDTLRRQLPLPYSAAGMYDLYRLHNLVTLLELYDGSDSDLSTSTKSAAPKVARQGEQVHYTIDLIRTGAPLTQTVRLTDNLPVGLSYVPGSLTPAEAVHQDGQITWSGYVSDTAHVRIEYAALVSLSDVRALTNWVKIEGDPDGLLTRSETIIANGRSVYLPLTMKAWIQSSPPSPPPSASSRRANIPYFSGAVDWAETAIFWLGKNEQGIPSRNYADVRVAYTAEALRVRATVIDYYLWYRVNPTSEDDLTQYDGVAIFLDTAADRSAAPQADDYTFLIGAHYWPYENAVEYHRQARGTGTGWDHAWAGGWMDYTAMQWESDPGPNDNSGHFDYGWTGIYTIPWGTLGYSGPPSEGTLWGLGVLLYDRDEEPPAGFVTLERWPEAFDANSPATWGELHFGYADYEPSLAVPQGTTTIRAASPEDNTVEDAWMGGGGWCAGGHEGGSEINHGDDGALFIGTETAPTHFPCFNKSYLRFSLDDLPPGKTIISASLTLHLWGHAGETEGLAQPSWVHLFTIDDPWEEMTIHWNNAPLAYENVSAIWVYPYSGDRANPEWPGDPYHWDATQAVAEAYAEGRPVSVAIYGSDTDQHSSKYLTSSETGDWNEEGRPTLTVVWGQAQALSTEPVRPTIVPNNRDSAVLTTGGDHVSGDAAFANVKGYSPYLPLVIKH